MKAYLKSWNLIRIIQLAIAILVVIQGFQNEDYLWVLLGSFFSLFPVLNVSCCGPSGCSVELKEEKKNNNVNLETNDEA